MQKGTEETIDFFVSFLCLVMIGGISIAFQLRGPAGYLYVLTQYPFFVRFCPFFYRFASPVKYAIFHPHFYSSKSALTRQSQTGQKFSAKIFS